MYHEEPLEAAEASPATIHRRPKGQRGATQDLHARLLADYQLDKVVDYILTFRHCDEERPHEEVAREEAKCTASESGSAVSMPKPMLKIALQFPDTLLDDVTNVTHELETRLHADPRYPAYQTALRDYRAWKESQRTTAAAAATVASSTASRISRGGALSSAAAPGASALNNPNAPTDHTRFFVLADNTFGSCCPDEITALHYDSDCIVHFGEACMSKATRLPVLYIHPSLNFKAIAAGSGAAAAAAAGVQPPLPSRGEVNLLTDAVERVRAAIQRRREAWNKRHTKEGAACAEAAGEMRICPRLVVVGTPASTHLLQEVEKALHHCSAGSNIDKSSGGEETASMVPIDWCSFDRRKASGQDEAGFSSSPSSSHAVEAVDADDTWVVNGARFPRLTSFKVKRGNANAREGGVDAVVQHFLFIGPSSASHPIHLHGIHQYNNFHYPSFARSYFDDDNSEDDVDDEGRCVHAPMLFVIDEQFAVSTDEDTAAQEDALAGAGKENKGGDKKAARRLSADASKEEAHAFLSAAFHDGGGAIAEGSAAQSARALTTIHRRLNQRSFNIEAVRASSAVGILVASLAIDGYYECTMLLHQLLRAYGKRSYILYVGHLNEFKLANFADTVDCFVVVACPNARHCHFPEKSDNYMKRVVSPAEVLLALTVDPNSFDDNSDSDGDGSEAERTIRSGRNLYGMPGLYNTEFLCILPPLREALAQRKQSVADAAASTDKSGTESGHDARLQDQWRESAALIRMTPVGAGVLTATNHTVQGALARLHEREYVGLNPQIGQTVVQESIVQGKHGIARGYATEREAQQKQ